MEVASGREGPPPSPPVVKAFGRLLWPWFTVFVIIVALFVAPIVSYERYYAGKVHKGIYALGMELGGLQPTEARQALLAQFRQYAQQEFTLRLNSRTWKVTPAELGLGFEVDSTVAEAYAIGRNGGLLSTFWEQLTTRRSGREVGAILTFDEAKARDYLNRLATEIDRPLINSTLVAKPDFSVEITPSHAGLYLDREVVQQRLRGALTSLSAPSEQLVVKAYEPSVREEDLSRIKDKVMTILKAPITVQWSSKLWTLQREELAKDLVLFDENGYVQEPTLDKAKLTAWAEKIAEEVNRPPRDARLRFQDGKVALLTESQEGWTVDVPSTVEAVEDAAFTDRRNKALPVQIEKPNINSSDLNKIVVKDLIADSSIDYAGGIPERQHNIELATSRLNGAVIPPGAVFSFNQTLGRTRLVDGYKVGFGIVLGGQEVKTVPSVGGGICQVATTLFQAAFWAGLEIVERNWHLYWIPRYGQPPRGLQGLDATVDEDYGVDLKFRNNTGNWIAIASKTDGKKVSFAIYGVDPGWEVEVGKPQVTNVVKADPEIVTEEDPTMPEGKKIQIESAFDGFKVSIPRTVKKDGQVVDRYVASSSYYPARNVVLVGTKKEATQGEEARPLEEPSTPEAPPTRP